jgi:hypothetical protein
MGLTHMLNEQRSERTLELLTALMYSESVTPGHNKAQTKCIILLYTLKIKVLDYIKLWAG